MNLFCARTRVACSLMDTFTEKVMESLAHVHAVSTRLSPPLLEGLGIMGIRLTNAQSRIRPLVARSFSDLFLIILLLPLEQHPVLNPILYTHNQ